METNQTRWLVIFYICLFSDIHSDYATSAIHELCQSIPLTEVQLYVDNWPLERRLEYCGFASASFYLHHLQISFFKTDTRPLIHDGQ